MSKAKAVAEVASGVTETWGIEAIAKLLWSIPHSSYFSLSERRDRPSGEWKPNELGEFVGHLQSERAKNRDFEFYMDLLIKLLTLPEKEGGWGKETNFERPASTDIKTAERFGTNGAYDFDYVPQVVGPALGPFFQHWDNKEYAMLVDSLVAGFLEHATRKYGPHTVSKEIYHKFCQEMIAQTAIASKPTIGLINAMIFEVTSGWDANEADDLVAKLEIRMKPYHFLRRWWRKITS